MHILIQSQGIVMCILSAPLVTLLISSDNEETIFIEIICQLVCSVTFDYNHQSYEFDLVVY